MAKVDEVMAQYARVTGGIPDEMAGAVREYVQIQLRFSIWWENILAMHGIPLTCRIAMRWARAAFELRGLDGKVPRPRLLISLTYGAVMEVLGDLLIDSIQIEEEMSGGCWPYC